MVRFGIVGFGLHAVRRMMPAFALATNSQATALSRRDMGRARATALEWKIPEAFDSVEQLSRSPEVDAVFITSPNSCHLADVLAAVKHRKPVLCEKPLGMNAAECRQMVEAARQAKVLFGVAHVFRFDESTRRLRERLAAGEIGEVVFARSEFSFPAGAKHPRGWIYDPAVAGGGPVADVGVHCIDTLRFLLQDEVARVSARASRTELSGEMEAASILTLEFSRGALATALVSFRAEYRCPLEIVGETGVLRADDGLTVDRPVNIHLRRAGNVVETETVSNQFAYARMLDSFADAVEGKGVFPVLGEEGWQNQEVLDAAYRSIQSGRVEVVPRIPA